MKVFNKPGVDLSNGLEDVPVLCEDLTFPSFQYCPDNVQGPGCDVDPSEVSLPGCSCLSRPCRPDACPCLQASGGAYDGSGALLLLLLGGADSGYSPPVFECNALCACGDACSNRVVQRGLRLRLEVLRTPDRGWGVRTLEPVRRGAFVCEYAGEVIGPEDARRRQRAQGAQDSNYIIAVREHAGAGPVAETFVDPARAGNVGRFLNHSCRPNLVMVPVRVHSVTPRLALFAERDVDAGEELTFDYSGAHGNRGPAQPPNTPSTDSPQRKACHCGADTCTRVLPLDLSILG